MNPFRRGMTLTEILIVVSILAVIVGLCVPAIGTIRAGALATACASNQRQMITGVMAYVNDDRGYVPANDWVAGCDYPQYGTPSPLFSYLGGHGTPPVPSYMAKLVNTRNSGKPVDVMTRLEVTQCPLIRRIWQTQNVLGFQNNPQNERPNYVSARGGPPNIALNNDDLGATMSTTPNTNYLAAYTTIRAVARPSACGFVFCSNFRIDRLGVDLASNANGNPTNIFLPHTTRKDPNYGTTAWGGSFDVTDPGMYQGRVNVAYLDGRVQSLAYRADPTTLSSIGGGEGFLPAASPRGKGSDYSLFLRGGN